MFWVFSLVQDTNMKSPCQLYTRLLRSPNDKKNKVFLRFSMFLHCNAI